jgi:uncharacterized protein (DUF2252 family)
VDEFIAGYLDSLDDSRRRLMSRYRIADVAHKVVGVGSVGTRCFITLWLGADEADPLFLPLKEARPSLLEPYLGRSVYDHPGERIVTGQRLMQASHDIFLGFGRVGPTNYFIRQLYDMKGSFDLADLRRRNLPDYAGLCAAVLARAHARTGDPAMIAGYLGRGKAFDRAVTAFAFTYADQTAADHRALAAAVREGRVEARQEG